MAEVITETILPGTYIEVRPEGLLSIGAISTGNVGILGTAEKGSDRIQILSSYDDAVAYYGEPGSWDNSDPAGNLTLVRALKYIFDNGALTVYAQRVFDPGKAKAATFTLTSEGSASLRLKARTPGEWGNRLQILVEDADTPQELIQDEPVMRENGSFVLSATKLPQLAEGASLGKVLVEDAGLVNRFQLRSAPAGASVVGIDPNNRTLTFAAAPSASAVIRASYLVPQAGLRKITLRFGNVREVFLVPSLYYFAKLLDQDANASRLVEIDRSGDAGLPGVRSLLPTKPERPTAFQGGENGEADAGLYQVGLDNFLAQDVQLLFVGRPFKDVKAAVLGHLEKTENLGRERIAVLGADSSEPEKILENANDVADKRLVLVAPGLSETDPDTGQVSHLPPLFAAAAVTGKLSSLSPHVSPTNKTLAGVESLEEDLNYGEMKALVQNRVLALQRKRGIRVVKGISTDDGAFQQITTRRIVDYVKEGTRIGANQYIGKLNNRRVRENLRTTLDRFLADLLLREFLVGYKLDVTADRAMEIRGEVLVKMDIQPTFSIDVVRVIMTLS